MKKMISFCISTIITGFLLAQEVPKQFNYQGVARNAAGQAIASQPIKVRATLISQGPSTSTDFYSETRNLTTNALGLFSFRIGGLNASNKTGNLTDGDWLNPDHTQHLKIELDINNSGTWTDMGTQQIVSVPYALYSNTAYEASRLTHYHAPFSAYSTNGQTVAAGATTLVSFEDDETGSNNFNTSTNEYSAQERGLHQFSGTIHTSGTSVASGSFYIMLYVNGVVKKTFRFTTTNSPESHSFNAGLYLQYNQKVTVYVKNELSIPLTIGAGSTYFSGTRTLD